ncbi:A/G-specific adenine glycosylase [Terrarubrum flagellatum]|uniref:A/G-specific adenine glycosylase n=1 Tax=Terrirubrum flagellatum TaxID=2895980 RepID=UPI0031452F6F
MLTTPRRQESPRQADPAVLLAWYDRHARLLPWRARKGERADPYRVWLSEIMLQQTTVTAVKPFYEKFLSLWPDVTSLANAPVDAVMSAWAGLGYYSRARNLHACAKMVAGNLGGVFPRTEDGLRALPGVGPYTAAAIAAIAYDLRAVVIDGNVERVITRLFAIEDPLPQSKPAVRAAADSLTPDKRAGDFAQAMMDLGATICTPRKPACALCPWMSACVARGRGDQESFPRKTPKKSGAMRFGAAFVVIDPKGRLLARTRPAKGLLGGMAETPTTEWSAHHLHEDDLAHAPVKADWRKSIAPVEHVFTHFPLRLSVYSARLPRAIKAPSGMRWVEPDDINSQAWPGLMRKVLASSGLISGQ